MHELPVVQAIFSIVMEHASSNDASRVTQVNLAVGELTDLVDEWIEKYFQMLAKGTIAEGAGLDIERRAAMLRCGDCGREWATSRDGLEQGCPDCCSQSFEIVSGREYTIDSIVVE